MCSSPNIAQVIMSSIIRWAGQVARMGDKKRCIQGFGGALRGKSPLGRLRYGWEDNTIMDPFYYQLMHITLKNAELLKHSKFFLCRYC